MSWSALLGRSLGPAIAHALFPSPRGTVRPRSIRATSSAPFHPQRLSCAALCPGGSRLFTR
jgi:hypothetical protein